MIVQSYITIIREMKKEPNEIQIVVYYIIYLKLTKRQLVSIYAYKFYRELAYI